MRALRKATRVPLLVVLVLMLSRRGSATGAVFAVMRQ